MFSNSQQTNKQTAKKPLIYILNFVVSLDVYFFSSDKFLLLIFGLLHVWSVALTAKLSFRWREMPTKAHPVVVSRSSPTEQHWSGPEKGLYPRWLSHSVVAVPATCQLRAMLARECGYFTSFGLAAEQMWPERRTATSEVVLVDLSWLQNTADFRWHCFYNSIYLKPWEFDTYCTICVKTWKKLPLRRDMQWLFWPWTEKQN